MGGRLAFIGTAFLVLVALAAGAAVMAERDERRSARHGSAKIKSIGYRRRAYRLARLSITLGPIIIWICFGVMASILAINGAFPSRGEMGRFIILTTLFAVITSLLAGSLFATAATLLPAAILLKRKSPKGPWPDLDEPL